MLAHCPVEQFFINFRFQPFFSDRDQAVAWEYDLSQRWVITLAVTRLTIITIIILVTTIITISPSAMSHRTRKEILELHVAPVCIHLPLSAPSSSSSSSSPSILPAIWLSLVLLHLTKIKIFFNCFASSSLSRWSSSAPNLNQVTHNMFVHAVTEPSGRRPHPARQTMSLFGEFPSSLSLMSSILTLWVVIDGVKTSISVVWLAKDFVPRNLSANAWAT